MIEQGRDRSRQHRWALLVTHTIGIGSPLLERTRVIQTPLFGVYLHRHHRPDRERHLHDHPWGFCSLILRGGYAEEWAPTRDWAEVAARVPDGQRFVYVPWWSRRDLFSAAATVRTWRRWSLHRIRRGEFHSIRAIKPGTVSLLLVGRRRSGWGFATEHGFVPATEYRYASDRGIDDAAV